MNDPLPAWRAAACAALFLGTAGAARADGPAAPASAAARDAHADAAWLQSVQDAARKQSFAGTIVYSRGEEVHASRVIQSYSGGALRERVLTLDGQPREFIRQDEEVQCLYPRLHRVVIEHGGKRSFPAFAEPLPPDLLDHYELRRDGSERVAGSSCDVVTLVPRDHMRYGYRLCVEPASSLLLKAQTVTEQGAVLEQIAFTDVRIGEPIDAAQLKPSWSTAGWEVLRHDPQPTQLVDQGWSVTPPNGFHLVIEVVRNMFHGQEHRSTLQAVYSDGLATVSVFIEPGAPDVGEPGESANGPVNAVTRNVGDARVTVVGEVPSSTAHSFAESVVHAPPAH